MMIATALVTIYVIGFVGTSILGMMDPEGRFKLMDAVMWPWTLIS